MSAQKPKGKYVSLPMSRINTIMKSSPDVSNVTPDAVLMTTKAAELFIGHLAKLALENSESGRPKYLDYTDVANIVLSDEKLAFLKDVVPHKITVREYREILEEVEAKERKLNGSEEEDDEEGDGVEDDDGDQDDE